MHIANEFMTDKGSIVKQSEIQNRIYTLRSVQVMLDSDLAELYNVSTSRLNEQVKRNISRFPDDFMFQLADKEWKNLISQNATSSWGGRRKLPNVFTEQGISSLSGILKSDIAIKVNIAIMRAFIQMRKFIINNALLFQKIETLEIKQIETLIANFIKIIKEFKDSYISDEKSILVVDLKQEITHLEKQKYRLEQNDQCEKYSELKDVIKQLEGEQKILKSNLVQSQSVYLEKYFKGIDQLFNQFGSKDFTLEMETDDRGIKKVYGLSVKYKNQKITNKQLPVIFSESDRRALALAVFWTNINIKSDEEQKNTVIIFDDPITSFDDQRVTKTLNLLKETLSKVNQIISVCKIRWEKMRAIEIKSEKDKTGNLIR